MLLFTNNLGYLPNEVLNASYNYSKHEQDLLLMLVNLYQDKPDLTVRIEMITSNWGETNSKHEELRKALRNLQSKPLEYYDQKNEMYVIASLIIESRIDTARKLVHVKFSDKIGEILTKAKSHFSKYNFATLLNLESRYSKRLYLHCNAFRSTGIWKIDIDQLRKKFDLKDKYSQTFDLKKKILIPAFAEIMEKSELDLDVVYLAEGKKIHTMVVNISIKEDYLKQVNDKSKHWDALIEFGLANWQADQVCKFLDEKSIAEKLNYIRMNRNTLKRPGAYLRTMFIDMGVPLEKKL